MAARTRRAPAGASEPGDDMFQLRRVLQDTQVAVVARRAEAGRRTVDPVGAYFEAGLDPIGHGPLFEFGIQPRLGDQPRRRQWTEAVNILRPPSMVLGSEQSLLDREFAHR